MGLYSRSIVAGVITLAFLTGPALSANTHPITGEALADDQTFKYSLIADPSSLDPQLTEDVAGAEIVRDLFEGLMNQAADGTLVPGVATGFTANADNTVYTFHLRPEALWSDGAPVTADDFVYAWRRAIDPRTASPYAWFVEVMGLKNAGKIARGKAPVDTLGVEAIDDRTLRVSLSASIPYFALMTTHQATFPTPSWAISAHGSAWTQPDNIVSNGAYILTDYVAGKGSVRSRNARYWNNAETIIGTVIAYIVPNEDEAVSFFDSGGLDRVNVPSGQYPALKASYPDEVKSFPRLCTYYYIFNMSEQGPVAFKDVRVRKALSYAVDRNVIVDTVLQGGQFPAFTFTPGFVSGFSPPKVDHENMTQMQRDAEAVGLMASAGYGPDNPLSFIVLYNTSQGHKNLAEAIIAMWHQKLGVNAQIQNMDWTGFLEQRGGQKFDIARAGWCGDYNEASTFLDLVQSRSGYNDGKYSNPEVDDLLAASRTTPDPQSNYTQIERLLAEDMPLIPIYHYSGTMMLSAKLKNWPLRNVEQVWYSRNLYKSAD